MEFFIKRVSGKKVGIKRNDLESESKGVIEIESLEDLIQVALEVGGLIIINASKDENYYHCLEIYDDYRE